LKHSVCCHFQDKVRYWSKIEILSYPAFEAPVKGVRRNIAKTFGMETTSLVRLPVSERRLMIRLAILTQ